MFDKPIILNWKMFRAGAKARCWGPIIICPDEYRSKYLAHETKHFEDWRADPFFSVFKWLFNWRYGLWLELRGYHKSDTPAMTAMVLNRSYGYPVKFTADEIGLLTQRAIRMNFEDFNSSLKAMQTS